VEQKNFLRKEIVRRQYQQDKSFYDEISRINDRTKSDRALSDLLNSSRIPVVRKLSNAGPQSQLDSLTARGLFPPLIAYDDAKSIQTHTIESKTMINNRGKSSPKTSDTYTAKKSSKIYADAADVEQWKTEQIAKAFQNVELAKLSVDPNSCYYDAAVIFNQLNM
jgi:hypothetical protein